MVALRRKTTVYSFVRLIVIVCICMLHGYKPAHAQNMTTACASPRVRRAWGTLSTTEKQLYLDAVMAAMSSGNHALFLDIHSDSASGNEGHRTCGMLYWHRRFILAYENMLRSLEPRFACLTIPYWDYYTDYAKKTTSLCSTFENCSMILSEFGGSAGPVSTKSIGGTSLTGNCVDGSQVSPSLNLTTSFSLSSFCQNSSVSGTDCWKCVPRDNWALKIFPSGFSLASLARLISVVTAPAQPFSNFAQNLHYGAHNTIHNSAGSMMATLWASADPIFYNHQ
uniref:Tyrosinase copper-binding domain-containing protein n=1 Tax=Globisporangium ultimum (strain ATCC 200006 / CBS 805.95 / DAOM BR144) TaxID=431595 RepID=K3X1M1_GLOUD